METACALCPHPAETIDVYPYEGDIAEAPWINLRCQHRFHTHCFGIRIAVLEERDGNTRLSCPVCSQSLVPEEALQQIAVRRTGDGFERSERERIFNLWNTNDAFREDVLHLKKLSKESRKFRAKYMKNVSVLRREWKQLAMPSIEYLKSMKDTFIRRAQETEYRSEALQAYRRFHKKNMEIRHTYDTGFWGLGTLADVAGAPRFEYPYGHGVSRTRYFFRARI